MQGSPTRIWTPADTLASKTDNTGTHSFPSLEHFVHRLREAHVRGGVSALARVMREESLDRRAAEPFALLRDGRYTRTCVYRGEIWKSSSWGGAGVRVRPSMAMTARTACCDWSPGSWR